MRGIIIILTALALTFILAHPINAEPAKLSYNGVYRGKNKGNQAEYYWSYLRFYEDGTVIETVSEGQPDDLKAWFDKDNENVFKGTYSLDGNKIIFTVLNTKFGSLTYEGTVTKDGKLKLEIFSGTNGKKSKDEYRFVEW